MLLFSWSAVLKFWTYFLTVRSAVWFLDNLVHGFPPPLPIPPFHKVCRGRSEWNSMLTYGREGRLTSIQRWMIQLMNIEFELTFPLLTLPSVLVPRVHDAFDMHQIIGTSAQTAARPVLHPQPGLDGKLIADFRCWTSLAWCWPKGAGHWAREC